MTKIITIDNVEYHQILAFNSYYISKEAVLFKKLEDGTLKRIKKSQNSVNNPMTNYEIVSFYINKIITPKGKKVGVHQIMAETFLPRIPSKDIVNHIDGNKQNNHISNLEWCTQQENIQHAWATNLSSSEHCEKVIYQYSLEGAYLNTYSSLAKATEFTNIPSQNISKCANGLRATAGGYIWDFTKQPILKTRNSRKQYMYIITSRSTPTTIETISVAEAMNKCGLPSFKHMFKKSDIVILGDYQITRKEIYKAATEEIL